VIFSVFLENIDNKPAEDWPMIAALDSHISVNFFIDIKLINFIVFPEQDSVAVAGVAVFLQSVLSGLLVQFVRWEESDWAFSVKPEILKRGFLGLFCSF
jgi:hypothetical protein